jgi:CheY-like chemotaxis protein
LEADRPPTHGSAAANRAGARPLRVLVVEDDADARAALRMLLELHGHTVSEAAAGEGGVAHALAQRPDVAVIDIGLPGLDGYEVAQRIRGGLEGVPIFLIALTGYHEDGGRLGGSGFDAHLIKPIELDQFFELLERVSGAAVEPR